MVLRGRLPEQDGSGKKESNCNFSQSHRQLVEEGAGTFHSGGINGYRTTRAEGASRSLAASLFTSSHARCTCLRVVA